MVAILKSLWRRTKHGLMYFICCVYTNYGKTSYNFMLERFWGPILLILGQNVKKSPKCHKFRPIHEKLCILLQMWWSLWMNIVPTCFIEATVQLCEVVPSDCTWERQTPALLLLLYWSLTLVQLCEIPPEHWRVHHIVNNQNLRWVQVSRKSALIMVRLIT